ncbi:MAG: hypothetical protein PHQ81_04830, partial [Methanofollis sp.]|nr:hypothetical protein [Methanofollis sp.]
EEETILSDIEGKKEGRYSPIGGAYYAARLAVAEYLMKIQRSARAIVVRHVNSDYWAPLGSWVIREATRAAMRGTPVRYANVQGAAAQMDVTLGYTHWRERSKLLSEVLYQRTLFEF